MLNDEFLVHALVYGLLAAVYLAWFFTTWSAVLQINATTKRIELLLVEMKARGSSPTGPTK